MINNKTIKQTTNNKHMTDTTIKKERPKTQAMEFNRPLTLFINDEVGFSLRYPTGGKFPNFYDKTMTIKLTTYDDQPYVNPIIEESDYCYKTVCIHNPETNRNLTINLFHELASIELLQGLEVEVESISTGVIPSK
jgi:hypothetical protein